MIRKVTALAVLLSLTVTVVPAGAATSSPALTSQSAAAIATAAQSAALATKSCNIMETFYSNVKATGTLTTLASATQSQQVLTMPSIVNELRLVNNTVYFKGNKQDISMQFGVTNSKFANRWVSVKASDANFAPMSKVMSFRTVVTELLGISQPKKGAISTQLGHRVIAITGTPKGSGAPAGAVITEYVSTTAPYLPIETVGSYTSGKVKVQFVVKYISWGKTVSVSVPSPSVPISTTDL